jgi:hypothetical protein
MKKCRKISLSCREISGYIFISWGGSSLPPPAQQAGRQPEKVAAKD